MIELQPAEQAIFKGAGTPACNTGVQMGENRGFEIWPDWLTVVFPRIGEKCKDPVDLFLDFCGYYCLDRGLNPAEPGPFAHMKIKRKPGLHGYLHRVEFRGAPGETLLLNICWGGNNGTMRVELTGGGCRALNLDQYWFGIARALRKWNPVITRFDLAGDDFRRRWINPRRVRRDYASKWDLMLPGAKFPGGIPPRPTVIDSAEGYTVQLGTKNQLVQHVVYEKGKEQRGKSALGDRYPDWVRWEVRWRQTQNKYRIENSIVRPDRWQQAYFGATPYLADIIGYKGPVNGFKRRFLDGKEDQVYRFWRMLRVVRTQYGKALYSGERLVGRDGLLAMITAKEDHLDFVTLTQADLFPGIE